MIFFISNHAYSTHLVGGEMNYRYIEEDLYEIKLIVYRDCYRGEPDFDFPGIILVYSGLGVFEGTFNIPGDPKVLLPVEIDDECFKAPADVCVERKEYRFRGILPANTSGYYLSYQRCCRNSTILNIFDDRTSNVGDSGMNLFAFIPPVNTVEVNSNPVFNNFPPIAICVDKPLVVDHSATDYDGDSLVYKLCVPTDALSAGNPAVNSANYDRLPFVNVRWRNPYSLENVLGGTDKLKIDSKTGLLTAVPTTMGQFVVGVCVEEYRNGVFLTETKRDFQFNVSVCGKYSVSSFFTFDTICNSLNVNFKNQSIEADNFLWSFGDGKTSTEKDPNHVFPGYGEYNVRLIASSENGCSDTLSKKIVLKEENFNFEIADVSVCNGKTAELVIQTSGQAVKNVHWLVSPSIYTTRPEYSFTPASSQIVNYEISTTGGCTYTGSVNVNVHPNPVVNILVDPEMFFGPGDIKLSSLLNNNYSYQWSTTDENTTPQSAQTIVHFTQDQWAYLNVTHNNGGCTARDSVYLEKQVCDFSGLYIINKSLNYKCSKVDFEVSVDLLIEDVETYWIVNGENILSSTLQAELNYNEDFNYQLVMKMDGYCADTLTFTESIDNPAFTIQKLSPYKLCKEESNLVVDLGIQSTLDYTVSWGGNSLSNEDVFEIQLTGQDINIPVRITYSDSCVVLDTVKVDMIDLSVAATAQPAVLYKGQETTLSASPQGLESYQWYPEDIPSNSGNAQTTAIIYETTDFIVIARDENGCQATDTVTVEVRDDRCSEENIYIPNAFTPNGDGVNDIWKVRSEVAAQVSIMVYNRWGEKVFESQDISLGWDGTFNGKSAESGTYSYYLTIVCENQLQYFSKGNITLLR